MGKIIVRRSGVTGVNRARVARKCAMELRCYKSPLNKPIYDFNYIHPFKIIFIDGCNDDLIFSKIPF